MAVLVFDETLLIWGFAFAGHSIFQQDLSMVMRILQNRLMIFMPSFKLIWETVGCCLIQRQCRLWMSWLELQRAEILLILPLVQYLAQW